MLQKQLVRERYITELERKLEWARRSYEIAKKDTIEAEGRMITRYDSTKTETAWLADGYLKEVKELEQCIENMKIKKEFANITDTVFLDLLIHTEYQGTFQYSLSRTGKDKIPEELFIGILGSMVGDSVIVKNRNNQQTEYRLKKIVKGSGDMLVGIESLVSVTDDEGDSDYYITNYLGGMTLEMEEGEVFCVSKETPIAKALLGRKKGESTTMSMKEGMCFLIKDFR